MEDNRAAFPTVEQATSQIPVGKLPYITVRNVLIRNSGIYAYESLENSSPAWWLGVAIAEVADSCRSRVIEPPLPTELEELVLCADQYIERIGDQGEGFARRVSKISPGFEAVTAKLILEAVYENGYGKDLPAPTDQSS